MSIKTSIAIAAALGAAGVVTANLAQAQTASPNCREFQQTITVGGETQEAYGTTCQQPDGRWKVVGPSQAAPLQSPPGPPQVEAQAQAMPPQAAAPPVYPAPAYPAYAYAYPYYAYPYPYYAYPTYAYAPPVFRAGPVFRVAARGRFR